MRRMVRALALLLPGLWSAAAVAASGKGALEPVDKALEALGGADKLGALKALTLKGEVRHWEPEQSMKPGGEARLAGDSTFVATRDLGKNAARIEWARKLVYPSPREYRFTEIITPGAGAVQGVDSTGRTKQSQESDPPQHAMSGLRLAAAQRELQRTSPLLVLEMKRQKGKLSRLPDVEVDGKRLPAVRYQAVPGSPFLVMFDPESGRPARVRTMDADNILGDSAYDLVLSDWKEVEGVQVAHEQRYLLNGKDIAHIKYQEVQAAPSPSADALQIPGELRAQAPKPATKDVPWQWVLRRQHIGTYLDTDAVTHDPKASPGLRLSEVAPGVQQVVGGSHNSLVVELADGLAVLDAPIGERQSKWTVEALRKKYPKKPLRYVVLTHHHMDHAGGVRTFAAEGATVVVGQGAKEHFERVLAAPHTLDNDALQRKRRKVEVVEVADQQDLGNGKLLVYRIENPHAEGMLMGWIPEAKLGFVTDIWSPGRDKLGDKATPGQMALVSAVKKHNLAPERIAGGHGTTADYASLEALAAKSAPSN